MVKTMLSDSVVTLSSDKTEVEVYTFGALLNRFAVEHNESLINVVEGFSSPEDARQNLAPFFRSAKLSPYVCRVKDGQYSFGDRSYLLSKYASHGNALHGLLYNETFVVKNSGSSNDCAFVELECVYDKTTEGFPFTYSCAVEYKLQPGNALTVTTTVKNLGQSSMPVTDGWHPYFTLGDTVDEYLLEFQSKEMLEFDEALIPTGKLLPYEEYGSLRTLGPAKFDNCFTLNFAECQPLCVVRNPLKKLQLAIYPTNAYPYLQIYTPDSRKSIAIENLSGAPDAFNNGIGLKVLAPGETATFSTKFVIQSL